MKNCFYPTRIGNFRAKKPKNEFKRAVFIVLLFNFFSVTSGCSRQIEANLGAMKKLHKEHKEILDILKTKHNDSFLDMEN